MTNSRFREIAPGVVAEAIATDSHVRINPATGDAAVDFHYQDFVTVNGQVLDFSNGKYDFIPVPFETIAKRCFGAGLVDPSTGLKLDYVSGAGVLLLFKAMQDAAHNDRAALMATPVEM